MDPIRRSGLDRTGCRSLARLQHEPQHWELATGTGRKRKAAHDLEVMEQKAVGSFPDLRADSAVRDARCDMRRRMQNVESSGRTWKVWNGAAVLLLGS